MPDTSPWCNLCFVELLTLAACYPSPNLEYARRWIITPSAFAIISYAFTQSPISPDNSTSYCIGIILAFRMCFLTHLVYLQPGFPNYWRRVKDGKQPPSTFTWKKKIFWMFDLALGVRGVGWEFEPKGGFIPPRPHYRSRLTFVMGRVALAIINLIVLEFFTLYQLGNPDFDPSMHLITDGPETYLSAQPIYRRYFGVALWGLAVCAGIRAPHFFMSAILCGLGLSHPDDWPDMIGTVWDTYTLNKSWGRVWQQAIRSTISGIGIHVAERVYEFIPRPELYCYVQLLVSFFVSGAMHLAADYMVLRRLPSYTMQFFIIQGTAIALEAQFQKLARPLCLNPKLKWANIIFGWCWTVSWVTVSVPPFLDSMSVHGYGAGGTGFMWLRNLVQTRIVVERFIAVVFGTENGFVRAEAD